MLCAITLIADVSNIFILYCLRICGKIVSMKNILLSIFIISLFLNCRNENTKLINLNNIIIEYHYNSSEIAPKTVDSESLSNIIPSTEISGDENIIIFGRVPATDVRVMYDQHQPFTEYLSDKLNKKVELKFYSSYSALIEATAKEEIDIAWFGPVSYVLAEQRIKELPVKLYPLVKPQRHGSASLECEIIVRLDSNINELSDLENKHLAFTDPKSSAGFVLPIAVIEAEGINIAPIDESNYLRHYGNVAKSVYFGKFDAGGLYTNGFFTELTPAQQKEMKILTRSEPVPREPICWVGRNVSEEKIDNIRNVILNVPLDLISELRKAESLEKFHPADADEYELLINLVGKVAEKYEGISE